MVVWYELEKGHDAVWKKHDFGNEAAGHGVGSGDVNGDGRIDLLTPKGWFEAPSDPRNATWAWHPEWDLGAAGIQILARDVDGDGLSDVVWGNGHDLRPVLDEAGEGRRRQAGVVEAGDDRRHDRLGPHPALGRPQRRRQATTNS